MERPKPSGDAFKKKKKKKQKKRKKPKQKNSDSGTGEDGGYWRKDMDIGSFRGQRIVWVAKNSVTSIKGIGS